MAANGRGNMRPAGRSPPFLAIGLFVALIILGFNYWSLSARNGEQSNEIILMESELRLVNAKKTSAEKRSEAISDKVSDLEKQLNQHKEIIANNGAELANVEKEKETFTNRVNELEIEVRGVRDQQLPSCEAEKLNVEREVQELKALVETYKNKQCTESDCKDFSRQARDTTLEDVYKVAGADALISMYRQNNDLGSYRGQIAGLAARMDQAAAQGKAHVQQQQQADSQQQQAGLQEKPEPDLRQQYQVDSPQQQQPDLQQQQQTDLQQQHQADSPQQQQPDLQQQADLQQQQQQQQPYGQPQQPDLQQQADLQHQQQQPYGQPQQPDIQQQQEADPQQQPKQPYGQSDILQQQQPGGQEHDQLQIDSQQQQQPLVPDAHVIPAPGGADTQNTADATNVNANTNVDNADQDPSPADTGNADQDRSPADTDNADQDPSPAETSNAANLMGTVDKHKSASVVDETTTVGDPITTAAKTTALDDIGKAVAVADINHGVKQYNDDDDDDEEDDAIRPDVDKDNQNPRELSNNENGIDKMFQRDREVQDTLAL